MSVASSMSLGAEEIFFTHDLTDDALVALYNACSLFVFPSLQEGFGLPVIEAMACGAPVLAANATSLPEVVGCHDMLFDPTDVDGLARKMSAVLTDPGLAKSYRAHGLSQAATFTWEACAQRVLAAFESRVASQASAVSVTAANKPRLAYVSPLPPERTGIADYSAELLPCLERHYDIEVVVDQPKVDDPWVVANYPIRDAAWLRANEARFDRILYQFGNSAFHLYQLGLMRDLPGCVVMHDSFIGAFSQWRAAHNGGDREYLQRLYHAHGYRALLDDRSNGRPWTVQNYPSNWEVLESAAGVVVHSEYAIDQVRRFYGEACASQLKRVAFPKHRRASAREASRNQLGFGPDDFVVCSFGMVAPTKLNHRLLSAWLQSPLCEDARCHLVFVGENHGGDYGAALTDVIKRSPFGERIRITGFVDHAQYHAWLEAADLAVQLRTESRGETSAAVFDCMGQGLPVIVNAHATFAELDDRAVCALPDFFDDAELASALARLFADSQARAAMSARAREIIDTRHHPAAVARQYRDAIETFAATHYLARETGLSRKIVGIQDLGDEALWDAAIAMRNNRGAFGSRRLFVDVTATSRHDLKTGIERVTRNITRELLASTDHDIRIEPVRFHEGHYVYCRDYACELLGLDDLGMGDEMIEISPGDIFFGLDWAADVVPSNRALFQSWRDRGASVYFLVHDLLPVLQPQFFPQGIDRMHAVWLQSIARCADGLVCVSRTVAHELQTWLSTQNIPRARPLRIGYSYSGAQFDVALAQGDKPAIGREVASIIERIKGKSSVLMVGTVEPRKGHRQALEAFDLLWKDGQDIHLVIVGKQGWMMEDFARDVRGHAMHSKRLHWPNQVSDAELQALYEVADVLLVASEGEGFGLPIIEAAQRGMPVIARDLPVFHEVAAEHATYFSDGADGLKQALLAWFALGKEQAPSSLGIARVNWSESAATVKAMMLHADHDHWLGAWSDLGAGVPAIGPTGLVLDMSQVTAELLLQGWSVPESWGCWALGQEAKLKVGIHASAAVPLRLSVIANAYVLPQHPRQTFELVANGQSLGSWAHAYGEDAVEHDFIIPAALLKGRSSLEVTVLQHDAIAPKAVGASSDNRPLGLAVKEIAFAWVQAGANA